MSGSADSLNLLLLNVGLATHNADWNWKDINSPFTRIYYVAEGSAYLLLPTGEQELKKGYLYLIPAFTVHSYRCNALFSHYYIHLYEETRMKTSFFDEWDFPVEVAANQLDLDLVMRLCEINPAMKLKQSNPDTYDNNPTLIENIIRNKQRALFERIESRGITYQLFSRFLKDAKPKIEVSDDRIQKVMHFIRKNIYEKMTISQLSGFCNLSDDHLIKLFKKETGSTPLQYINHKKIEKAQLILAFNDMPIKNVAYALSFDNHSYFNRLFKATTGLTPQEYRDSHNTLSKS